MFSRRFKIGDKFIGDGCPAYIVAEISGNHNGDYDRAVEIIHAAAKAGADAVKLQTYTADTLTIDSDKPYFRTSDNNMWAGRTLYDLYKEAYTPWEWQPKLKEEAKKLGLECFSSPFDPTSVDFLEDMGVSAYKIASYEINDIPLIRKVASKRKPVIFATGIAYRSDIERALKVCKEEGNDQIILLKCVSSYPTPYSQVNLQVMKTLAEEHGCLVGLSDHTIGSVVPVGSIFMGGKMIEKHLTLDRKGGGVDDAFSMEPDEFTAMVRDVRIAEEAAGSEVYELTDKQIEEREGSRSLFAVADIKAGEVISTDNVRSVRPGVGMHTMYYDLILGKKASTDVERGTPIAPEMIEGISRDDAPYTGQDNCPID
ncbi:MAG: pseudaminic acid synthase [Lachnospiraceae bacterium]|nr:pseudaminic acid synthase [Lachnospiraceae bacterium]